MNDTINTAQSTTNLPYAQSERLFRNYESHIAQIVDAWPQLVAFDVKGVTITTFNTRLRMALNSLFEHKWTTRIFMSKFETIYPNIVISLVERPGQVVVGPKGLVKNRRTQGHSSTTTQVVSGSPTLSTTVTPTEGLSITDPPTAVVEALLVLHHHQILVNPTIVNFTSFIDGATLDAGPYDVIVQREGNTFTIL